MPGNKKPSRKKPAATHQYSERELNWTADPIHFWTDAPGEDPLCRTGPATCGWTGPIPMSPAQPVRRVKPGWLQHEINPPERLFRFFDELQHANDFVNGHIWISTLETCRRYEDPLQGDPGEGTLGPNKMQDALVLCMTLRFSPEKLSGTFGKHCVEVANPRQFFHDLTDALIRRYPIERYRQAKVIYADRVSARPPGRIGFVKPADQYAEQEEHRMIWTVNVDEPLSPGLIKVPSVRPLCRLYDGS